MAISPYAEDSERTNPVKRIRWATQRVTGRKGVEKRRSIFRRHNARNSTMEKNRESNGTDPGLVKSSQEEPPAGEQGEATAQSGRVIYFNIPLPDHQKDDEGRPLQHFKRNKVRTAKYTPLSFVPKNLWFQFHNIANIFFLAIIILNFFSVFGATNPGLSAVPLIVIILLTAIKDGIEDWRRTTVDNELNNASVHRLTDWDNVNTADEYINPWRRVKKATTRGLMWIWRSWRNRKEKKQAKQASTARGLTEGGFDDSPESDYDDRRFSELTQRLDKEENQTGEDANGDVEMAPVPSPILGQQRSGDKGYMDGVDEVQLPNQAAGRGDAHQTLEVPRDNRQPDVPVITKKFYGSLIDPTRETQEKGRFKRDMWKNVQVGDFVRLYNEEQIPADIIVLSTSDADGACYVETKNLDGETNLKVRTALHSGGKVKRARDCERTAFTLESEPPHANLYAYSGVVRWEQRDPAHPDDPSKAMAEPVGINNMLLRGCTLRNTEWVVGIVAFTGEETKIMLNSGITPSKRARISKDLNWNVVYNFIILFVMCVVAAVVEGNTWAHGNESLDFFEFGSYGNTPALDGFITFWAAIILFQNLVPISLYISLEIVRTAQAYFIYSDTYMYYEKIDYPCTPKSWNISDDLGQIEYIFSDKTGTLTQNVMEFKKCTINGTPYGEAYTEALAGMQKRQGIDVEAEGRRAREQIATDRVTMIERVRKMHDNPYLQDDELTFVAPDFVADLGGEGGPAQRAACERFMLALALCHTVITERTPGDPPKIEFKAQSPDEAALVATARDVGFTVMGRSNEGIIINCLGEEREYTVLNTLEFNSTRKRMSAIMRMPDGKIVLFCKGADSVIYSRLKKGEQPELRRQTAEHLEMFAREGLRTLCIAQRELGEEEYQKWNIDHDLAAAAVQEREERLDAVADTIERELTLIGGTAIEDRLQDGVPDAIQLLAQAGIKLWVLTGDKVETAINIGFSCNLLNNDMELIVLKVDDENVQAAEGALDQELAKFGKSGSDEELKAAKKNHEPPAPTHALVIDGDTLKLVLDNRLRQKFLLLCKECKSVLCCRVSPSQKAAVVQMVKAGLEVMTLSIGDGANDVAMIQEADVGVGIAGEEGRQAVMSSDYAIGQFRFLTRLMLVHGRWSYRRLSETIANFFYKNIVWTFALFWYQIYTNMDCSYAFDYSYILLYNLAFTSLAPIFMGILDQDVNDKVSLAVPGLYRRGIERAEWTQLKFWTYMADGLYQSLICYFFTYLIFRPANFNTESGHVISDYKRMGVFIGNPVVVVVNIYILLNTYRWDWFMCLITGISILLIFLWTGAYTSFTDGFTFYGAAKQVYGSLSFWAYLLLTVVLCLLPRFSAKAFQKIYYPRDVDIIREEIRQGKFDYLKDMDAAHLNPLAAAQKAESTSSSSEGSKPSDRNTAAKQGKTPHQHALSDDMRPMYPPSLAATATTRGGGAGGAGADNTHSQNGSDGTDYTGHRSSLDRAFPPPPPSSSSTPHPQHQSSHSVPFATGTLYHPLAPAITAEDLEGPPPKRNSLERPRPSFDRLRSSMDRTRPSIENSRDFTSAAYLARMESSESRGGGGGLSAGEVVGGAGGVGAGVGASRRRRDVSEDLLR
ncbi:phospholipid transporting ATPase [Friedmanniomyces endolithicus]|uniref:Phospholipid-transporting ATPase n=1 Tax=Friedmanniomyces endolithicus TaxID=329885 RepID=A0AAN6JDM5_9PEZI|nr:phospholipid transporting ATPase [Friedmanniomyces endolithicus]KAK0294062.1 phospholipid transporting ATPase [Friedmanniomyces endolithicus]KAK0326260.1 phospholipid transporting ATPase [Friedmanniomyces endolithicus]KAK1001132.1 phospholipid transporting ATPase [Friedmanniomyces endolithicus]